MDFDLTEDQSLMRDTVREFLTAHSSVSEAREPLDPTHRRETWRAGCDLGWSGIMLPEEVGGLGSPAAILDAALVAEIMGNSLYSGPFIPTCVVSSVLAAAGAAWQDVLSGLLVGDGTIAWCVAEPGRPWAGDGLVMEARPVAGSYEISGVKTAVEDGAAADRLLVAVRCDGGTGHLLVDVGDPGVTVTPMRSLDLGRPHDEITFDRVRVPSDRLIPAGAGAALSIGALLDLAVVLQCAETVGLMGRVLDDTVVYAMDRVAFGRPIGAYQTIKHRLADRKLTFEAAAAAVSGAARALQDGASDAEQHVSSAKVFVATEAPELIQDCVQIYGGIGLTWEHDIHLFLRRATVNAVVYGSPAQHRERICSTLGMGATA